MQPNGCREVLQRGREGHPSVTALRRARPALRSACWHLSLLGGEPQQACSTQAGSTQAGTTQAGTTQAGTTQAGTTQAEAEASSSQQGRWPILEEPVSSSHQHVIKPCTRSSLLHLEASFA